MTTVDLRTAQQHLDDLTEAAAHGEDVIITRSDGRTFRLVLVPSGTPTFGSAAGQITIRDDFDDPLLADPVPAADADIVKEAACQP